MNLWVDISYSIDLYIVYTISPVFVAQSSPDCCLKIHVGPIPTIILIYYHSIDLR